MLVTALSFVDQAWFFFFTVSKVPGMMTLLSYYHTTFAVTQRS